MPYPNFNCPNSKLQNQEKEMEKANKLHMCKQFSIQPGNRNEMCTWPDIKIQLSQVSEGKVLHLLYSLSQLQIAQAFQSLIRILYEELAKKIIIIIKNLICSKFLTIQKNDIYIYILHE